MARFRGLLPGVLLVVVLPVTLALIIIAIGATTLHQNEMRELIATRDERAVREAANHLAERVKQQAQTLQAMTELMSLGVSRAEAQQRLMVIADNIEIVSPSVSASSSSTITTTLNGNVQLTAQSADGRQAVRGTFTPQALGLPDFASRLRGSADLQVMLLDQERRPLFHADLAHLSFDPASAFEQQPASESGSFFVADADRVEWVIAYAVVPQTGWQLIIAEPWEHVVNPLLRTSLLTPLVLIPAILIALSVVVFGARRVIRPLQQLEAQAARAGQGDYAALAQPISGISEIQILQATLGQMADQLRRYQRSLQSYAADVIRGQEDERTRLARELHDETVQALIVLDQQLQLIERTARRDPQAASLKLTELRSLTAGTIEEVRRVIRDLRPIYLEDLGLAPAVEMLTQSLSHPAQLEVSCSIEGEVRRLTPECELAVYRIVQEALNNVVKHAHARQAQVSLRFGEVVSLSVCDDGTGFALPERLDVLTERGHFGLIGMRERAELIGARLTFHSSPGQGTTVDLVLPGPRI